LHRDCWREIVIIEGGGPKGQDEKKKSVGWDERESTEGKMSRGQFGKCRGGGEYSSGKDTREVDP